MNDTVWAEHCFGATATPPRRLAVARAGLLASAPQSPLVPAPLRSSRDSRRPNDTAQQRGGRGNQRTPAHHNARPVCCSVLFGLFAEQFFKKMLCPLQTFLREDH